MSGGYDKTGTAAEQAEVRGLRAAARFIDEGMPWRLIT